MAVNPLAAILAAAFLIRVAVAWHFVYVVHPDETLQYLEQAHRLVFGSGVIPWEFLEGIRPWLLPALVAVPMKLGSLVGDGPWTYILAVRIACSAASVSIAYVGYRLVRPRAGEAAALMTAGFSAVWVDAVYFAPVVMSDNIAVACLFWAILCGDEHGRRTTRAFVISGVLLGLAFCIRFQLAPALLAVALWQGRLDRRRWAALAAGGLAIVLPVAGLLDWLTLGLPFQSIWLNFTRNALEGVSTRFGAAPWYNYVQLVLWDWTPLGVPLIALALVGCVRLPALGLAAAAIVASHSAVAHKEFRFIVFALLAAPILCGAGVSLLLDLRARPRGIAPRRRTDVAACAVLGGLVTLWSGFAATNGLLSQYWHLHGGYAEAMAAAGKRPDLCGVAALDANASISGGYTYLGRDVPLFLPAPEAEPGIGTLFHYEVVQGGRSIPLSSESAIRADPSAYNTVLGMGTDSFPGFARRACFANPGLTREPDACVFERPGGCS